ncbi:heme-binding domain-containing protein [Sediminibacterium roseum]|uniref:Heme-binding domain-containing protein n=1 Tax=Sediminibacterium roseum TaxID=1978412 RepID=A0ABW9ZSS6_9BACT|nr:heme-binding domain-containing protein [Sediminibacterium roseum]NCI49339.1 heme-binding domain-containing protein [Sediminibacterium roseum]
MTRNKKIILFVAVVLIAIQFIQPAHNINGQVSPGDFGKIYSVPVNVQTSLQVACYDCHSNNTRYPWYANIQPPGWMMARHIKNGKAKLNFSEFGSYTGRRQISKLKGIATQIKDGDMPLSSYTLIHKNAILSAADKNLIIEWVYKTADSLSAISN